MRLYEELLLLILHEEKGTAKGTYANLALAAGVLGELVTEGRLEVADDKKGTVTVLDASPTGEPAMDVALEKMASARRPKPLRSWIERIAGMRGLRDRVADPLVEQGVLREESKKVLGVFSSTRYPEADPEPQDELVERLRQAVFGDAEVDEHMCLLVAIASPAELLPRIFGRREVAQRKDRVEALAADERLGEATRKAVQQLQAAIITAVTAAAATSAAASQ